MRVVLGSVFGVFAVFFSTSAFSWTESTDSTAASDKTIAQYWEEVGLKFDLVTEVATERNCYASEAKFFGCIHALDVAVAASKPGTTLSPETRAAAEAPLETFGPARVTKVKPSSDENLGIVEVTRKAKEEREAVRQAWLQVFRASPGRRVPFADIAAWARRQLPPAKESEITAAAYNLYLGTAVDPHTRIAPRAYMDDESSTSETRYFGIGIQFRLINKRVVVQRPFEGSPALKAGMKSNDVITHVDGVPVTGLSTEDIVRKFKQPRGTSLRVTIQRRTETLELSVVCDEIVRANVAAKKLTDESRVGTGYIKLADFSRESACEEIEAAVEKLRGEDAKGLILDLRGNPGGKVRQALCIANVFLDRGATVYSMVSMPGLLETSRGVTMYNARTDLPLVTLVDAYSASASELLSGALQDHQRSLIVGTRSFGKGTAQSVIPWSRNSKIYYLETSSYFLLPSRRSNQLTGVVPDTRPVYRSPTPTDEDRFALREEDIYFNALPPPGIDVRFRQQRPGPVATVQKCVDEAGLARARFEAGKDAAIPADFQLLTAQDTLACAVEQGI